MDTGIIDENYANSENQLNEVSKVHLNTAGKWGQFLAIMGFLFSGLIILAGLGMAVMGGAMGMGDEFGAFPFAPSLIGIVYLLLGLVYLVPSYYLYKFSSKATRYHNTNHPEDLTQSLEGLKSMFKFMGIFTIVMIILYFLMFIGIAIFAGSMSGL